jgi:hypothetical protein
MQLKDLFEAIGDLLPGEKRVPPQIQLRNLEKVQRRINDLQDAIGKSDDLMALFKQDQELQNKLTTLQNRITRKVEMLYKVKARPTTGMDRMFALLDSECSEFIPHMQAAGKLLYRGTRNDEDQFEGRSRENREVKDSNAEISETFDRMLAQLGVQALRSNSIYTTSSYGFASAYGHNVYIIFPKNGYNFLGTNKRDLILERWNQLMDTEKLQELWQELDAWGQENVPNVWNNTDIARSIRYKEWESTFRNVKENFSWEGNPLKLPEKFNLAGKESEWVTPESVEKEFEPNTIDLVSAIRNGRELLINGEYWALKKRTWEELIRQRYIGGASSSWDN